MAKRFRFRLETVERLRKQSRDEQRRAVAQAVRDLSASEERASQLGDQLRDTVELTRGARTAPQLDIAALRGQQLHRNWLYRRIMESTQEIADARARLDAERTKLAEATAKLKVIEKLRERRWLRHKMEVSREEQRVSGEIAVQGYIRRRHEGREVGVA